MPRGKISLLMERFVDQFQFENLLGLLKKPISILIIVLFLGIGFRVYKAHYTGIVYDEVWTYEDYCKDLHTAVTFYESTNNHILNSIFIILTEKVLGGYEHFLRIPALLFGALFCGAITYIVHKTIRSPVMKIVILLLILLNWFIFDLTYLARGYAIALGVTFTGIAVLMHLSSRTSERTPVKWWGVILLIAMNFLAFGSMLSSLGILLSVNLAFVLLMILGSMKQGKKALINVITRVLAIVSGSVLSLYLLYQHVISSIMNLSEPFKTAPFLVYMKNVLYWPLHYSDLSNINFNITVYNASVILLIVCAVISLFTFFYRWKEKKGSYQSLTSPSSLILLLSAAVLLIMFAQNVIFGMSLGMPRNNVFLLPLVLISAGIIMDRAAYSLDRIKILSFLLRSVCAVLLALLCYLNLPSPRAVNVRPYDWGEQSAIGPLVRMLQKIDPDETWEIKLIKPHMESSSRSIRYYQKYGYNIKCVWDGAYDVAVYPEHTTESRTLYFENDLFADHRCCIVANAPSFRNKRAFYQVHHLTRIVE
jgi:hypothetical protein